MHCWGDKDFTYWKELNEAAKFIAVFCMKFGRITVQDWKEKWGTVRVYCSFGWYQLGEIISPKTRCYRSWPWYTKWVWKIYIPPLISRLFFPWQKFIYRTAYKLAIKKWPMIREEILCVADWSEYLGGL